jgi:hypothetical protein
MAELYCSQCGKEFDEGREVDDGNIVCLECFEFTDPVLEETQEEDDEEAELPEPPPLSDELAFTMYAAKEIMSQVFGDDFLYGMQPNTATDQLEVQIQSLFHKSVNLMFALPAKIENLGNFRRACVQVAWQMYNGERERTKELVIPKKKIILPGE